MKKKIVSTILAIAMILFFFPNNAFAIDCPEYDKPTEDTGTFTYNGEYQTYSPTGFDPAHMLIENGTQKHAGTFEVKVTPAEGCYWKDGGNDPVTFTWSIRCAEATIKADDVTKEVGEEEKLTVTISGLLGNDTKDSIHYTLSRESGEEVGTYLITPSKADQYDYKWKYETGTLTIVEKAPKLPPKEPEEPSEEHEYVPDMKTVNIEGISLNSWEEITANTPSLTKEKLEKVNSSNDDLLHVDIVGREDKSIPVSAVQAMKNSPITGLHVFIGDSDAVTFLNELDYTNYTGKNFKHTDEIGENFRIIDFDSKGSINAKVMFHTIIAPNVKAKVYKVVDGIEIEIASLSSTKTGSLCLLIDELAKYVIKY